MTETEKALWGLLDDIDTASDMFKPKHTSFYRYVMKKVEERHKYIISDGYNLFPCEDEDESITNKKGVVMEARELTIGSKRFTKILVLDKPGQGNACHEYRVVGVGDLGCVDGGVFGKISFQNGPVKEFGVNGLHQEDLLAIVIDRLQCFQRGEFECNENEMALTKIKEAMVWLNSRTKTRQEQGVEGTNKIHVEADGVSQEIRK